MVTTTAEGLPSQEESLFALTGAWFALDSVRRGVAETEASGVGTGGAHAAVSALQVLCAVAVGAGAFEVLGRGALRAAWGASDGVLHVYVCTHAMCVFFL
jgi:hypothetical protein